MAEQGKSFAQESRAGVPVGIDELEETEYHCVLVDEVPDFVTDDELQFLASHEVEQTRVDFNDVLSVFVGGCERHGVDLRVAGDIEVDVLLELQFLFHFVAEFVEVAEQLVIHFQAVALHHAAHGHIHLVTFSLAEEHVG